MVLHLQQSIKRQRRTNTLVRYGCLIIMFVFVPTAWAAKEPSPVALLRGVEAARTSQSSLRAKLTIETVLPKPYLKLEVSTELDGSRRRLEVRTEKQSAGVVTLLDEGEIHSFNRHDHEDVLVYDVRRAADQGSLIFDPRILGLSDTMTATQTVRVCLWYEQATEVVLVGKEEIKGVSVWRVKVRKKSSEADFWIEEPSFRVYRKTVQSLNGKRRIEIDSEFDASGTTSPLPRIVHIKRIQPNNTFHRDITVTSMEWPATIPDERFTLKSMDLPKNTAVVDLGSMRRIGFWNGEGLTKDPVNTVGLPSDKPFQAPTEAGRRWVVIIGGIVLLIVLIVVFVARRYRRTHA